MSVRTSRVTQLWHDRPWRRRKQEKEQPPANHVSSTAAAVTQDQQQQDPDNGLTGAIERGARRLSKIWKNNDGSTANTPPVRRHSLKQMRTRRSFFRPNDEPILVEDENDTEVNTAPPLERETHETLLKKLKRKSQNLSLPRPRTSSGIPRQRSFFGGSIEPEEQEVPAVPTLADPDAQQLRARYVPITIGNPQYDIELPKPVAAPGMAITTNAIKQNPGNAFTEKPKQRPVSSSSSFSQLRTRPTRTTNTHNTTRAAQFSESDSSDDDVLTALPSMDFKDFKDFHIAELRSPVDTYVPPVPAERHSIIQRVTPKVVDIIGPRPSSISSTTQATRKVPKVVDIVAPRPMSLISAAPTRKEPAAKERHKSIVQPVTTPIGPLEDGPKGDWTRTRHSWVGSGEGTFEQLEWDKLKQFMEAYGSGDGGIITVRPVDTDSSDSSGSARNSHSKFSNAQALAALEFGLT